MTKERAPDGAMWGGRFASAPDPLLRTLNDSLAFDWELLTEDVEGSIAWAGALAYAGVLNEREAARLRKALAAILREAKDLPPPLDSGSEDVHSWVEARLREKVGALAGKLHTGRSRNDQVATDLRLWLEKAFVEAERLTLDLADALARRAADTADAVMPGYTHLKQAEPVTFGHWCLAYAEMLLRDASRLREAAARADECPLGSGALAGTPLPIDREALAEELGFARPTANSLDAVSDRDAAAEYLFCVMLLLVHLSRMAEDLIFFSSDEAGFLELPDALATGSSRMPQKKNPDVLELARGWAARAIGELAGFGALLKGLPLAYDKDLQLDKEPLFRMRRAVANLLPVVAAVIDGLAIDRARMEAAAGSDALVATELADALAARGVPFRRAHEIVGRRFAQARASGVALGALPPGDGITAADLAAATPARIAARKTSRGGTAPARVRRAASEARKRIAAAEKGRR